MIGSGRRRKFKSPNKNYSEFKSAERPFSPSPKLKNYNHHPRTYKQRFVNNKKQTNDKET